MISTGQGPAPHPGVEEPATFYHVDWERGSDGVLRAKWCAVSRKRENRCWPDKIKQMFPYPFARSSNTSQVLTPTQLLSSVMRIRDYHGQGPQPDLKK